MIVIIFRPFLSVLLWILHFSLKYIAMWSIKLLKFLKLQTQKSSLLGRFIRKKGNPPPLEINTFPTCYSLKANSILDLVPSWQNTCVCWPEWMNYFIPPRYFVFICKRMVRVLKHSDHKWTRPVCSLVRPTEHLVFSGKSMLSTVV